MSFRGVAQSGRVLALGARCRRFESFRPDQKNNKRPLWVVFYFFPRDADSNLVLIFPSLWLGHNCGAFVTVWSCYARPHLLIVAPTRNENGAFMRLFLFLVGAEHGFDTRTLRSNVGSTTSQRAFGERSPPHGGRERVPHRHGAFMRRPRESFALFHFGSFFFFPCDADSNLVLLLFCDIICAKAKRYG